MPINTWGEFESAIIDTIKVVAEREAKKQHGNQPMPPAEPAHLRGIEERISQMKVNPHQDLSAEEKNKYRVQQNAEYGRLYKQYQEANTRYQITTSAVMAEILEGIKGSINSYYKAMHDGTLTLDDNGLNQRIDEFSNEFAQNNYVQEHLPGNFENIIKGHIAQYQDKMKDHRVTLQENGCYKFACDGRLNDGAYSSLETLGSLGSIAMPLGLLDMDTQALRKTIASELQRHATKQNVQAMTDGWKVFLCGGFGEPTNRNDTGTDSDFLPEHMWLEVHGPNGERVSIDTFPSRPNVQVGIRTNINWEGAPSEPDRVHTANKTIKVEIPGLPWGVITALANPEDAITRTYENDRHSVRERADDQKLFIKPNGELLKNNDAAQAYQELVQVINQRNAPAIEAPNVEENNQNDNLAQNENEQLQEQAPEARSMSQQVCDTLYENRGRIAVSVASALLAFGLYRTRGNSNSTTQTNEPPAPTSNPNR